MLWRTDVNMHGLAEFREKASCPLPSSVSKPWISFEITPCLDRTTSEGLSA
jgi:hypothetical protein